MVQTNGTSKRMIRLGLNHLQVAELLNEAIEKQLISYDRQSIKLSDLGSQILDELESVFKKTKKEEWIAREEKNRIPILDKKTIFVPNQKELFF